MTNYNKYLKYKDKYLKLKNLVGGTKDLSEEIVIGGISYKYVYGLYHKIFAQKENSLDPEMTTHENKLITRSELEKIIVAYFKQYLTGPFLMPGYTSFDNMILRARQIAKNDIGESEIKKMTEVTDAIIKNIKYAEIIRNEEKAAIDTIKKEEAIIRMKRDAATIVAGKAGNTIETDNIKEEKEALIFALLAAREKTDMYMKKAHAYLTLVNRSGLQAAYYRIIGIVQYIEEIRKSIKNLRGKQVKKAVKNATEAVKKVEEEAEEADSIYQSTINNMNKAKKAAEKASDSSDPIFINKMATQEQKEDTRSMVYAAHRYGVLAREGQDKAQSIKMEIERVGDLASDLLTAIEEEIEARIYGLKEMSKEEKAKRAKRWKKWSQSDSTEDEELQIAEDKRAQRAQKAIERAKKEKTRLENADDLTKTVRIFTDSD